MNTVNETVLVGLTTRLGEQLKSRGWLLATAESCTGGLVSQCVTAVAGSSEWFDRGFVTYSNDAKQDMLAVQRASLADYGAVSEVVAKEMVAGCLANSRASVALAITGVAGPGGGSLDKPVGTVWIAWGMRGQSVNALRHHFTGDRQQVRNQAAEQALLSVIAMLDMADE